MLVSCGDYKIYKQTDDFRLMSKLDTVSFKCKITMILRSNCSSLMIKAYASDQACVLHTQQHTAAAATFHSNIPVVDLQRPTASAYFALDSREISWPAMCI
jgi:SRSO17 transposase